MLNKPLPFLHRLWLFSKRNVLDFYFSSGPLLGRQASAPAVIDTNSEYAPYQDLLDSEDSVHQGYGVQSETFSDEEKPAYSRIGRPDEHLTK